MTRILTSTFHAVPGQEQGWMAQIDKVWSTLESLYDLIYVSATPLTDETRVTYAGRSQSLVQHLRDLGAVCQVVDVALGENYRAAVAMALDGIAKDRDDGSRIHYCDWDRILVWADDFADELEQVLATAARFQALFPYRRGSWDSPAPDEGLGSNNAWNSLPLTQKAPERVTNYGMNWGFNQITGGQTPGRWRLDSCGAAQITAGWLTYPMLTHSHFEGFPQSEWFVAIVGELLLRDQLPAFECVPVQGLRFETLEIHRYLSDGETFASQHPALFDELEGSKDVAVKRITIGEGMLQNYLDALDDYGFLNETIARFILDLIQSLARLRLAVEQAPDADGVRNVLETYYLGSDFSFDFQSGS